MQDICKLDAKNMQKIWRICKKYAHYAKKNAKKCKKLSAHHVITIKGWASFLRLEVNT